MRLVQQPHAWANTAWPATPAGSQRRQSSVVLLAVLLEGSPAWGSPAWGELGSGLQQTFRLLTAPEGMPTGSPFGPSLAALSVYLRRRSRDQLLVEFAGDVFGLTISQGAIANILARARPPMAAWLATPRQPSWPALG